jgi:glycosyltransferase involved in cell wall biosynthesis
MSSRALHIGLLAPPWQPVPPPAYGGIEYVVDQLARGLRAAGQRVTLYATGDSTAPVPTRFDMETAVHNDRPHDAAVELDHVMRGYEALADCDVVHDHTVIGPAWALAHGRDGVVTTCHSRLDTELRSVYRNYADRLPVVAISADQATTAPEISVDRVIRHGIDPEAFPAGRGDGGFLLFLGRMTPDKGAREAARIARAAGVRLLIAAKMHEPAERTYFAEQVEPLLGDGVEYVGEPDQDRKLELLGAATALLFPIRWPEPFGLVMVESLACGTPVLTHPLGAAPEIVAHGRTGFLCPDDQGLVAAVGEVGSLDREACRADAQLRFSTARMVAEHVDLYRDVVRGRAPAPRHAIRGAAG